MPSSQGTPCHCLIYLHAAREQACSVMGRRRKMMRRVAGCRGVFGAASGAGIAIGAYFAFYGAATNLLVRHSGLATGQIAFVAGAAAATGGSVVKVPLAVCIR